MAPYVGALWTPPWWGFDNGAYLWHAGYWGPHIGFYGGIDYGFGYTGRGYYGAYWSGGSLFYNRTVTNVNTSRVRNVYNYSVSSARGERTSYNGGHGGIAVRPTAQESAAQRDRRMAPVAAQIQHARDASANRQQFVNGGRAKPANLVAEHPLATAYHAPAERAPETRPAERSQPAPQPAAPSSAERMRQQPEQRPQPGQRPFAPQARLSPQEQRATPPRPAAPVPAQPESRANRSVRPESQPRLAPQEHAAPPRPALQERAAPPQQRPAPQQHAAPPRPTQQQHAAPPQRPAPQERTQQRPAPQAQQHAAPPRPTQQQHAAPPQRPAPQERTQQHPAPQAHPAPPREEQHPTPPPEKKKGQ